MENHYTPTAYKRAKDAIENFFNKQAAAIYRCQPSCARDEKTGEILPAIEIHFRIPLEQFPMVYKILTNAGIPLDERIPNPERPHCWGGSDDHVDAIDLCEYDPSCRLHNRKDE